MDDLRRSFDELMQTGFGIVPALVTVVVAVFLARALRRRARRGLDRIDALGRIKIAPNSVTLVENAISVLVFLLAALVILGILGIRSTSLVTFVGLLTAAVTLSLQDILRNLVAGVFLLLEQPFAIGDRIKVGADEGVVERVGIRTTVIRTARQEPVLIPNIVLFTQPVTNRSGRRPDATRPDTLAFRLTGIDPAPDDPVPAVRDHLSGVPGLVLADAEVDVEGAGAAGLDLLVTLPLLPNTHVPPGPVIAALRAAFPTATVSRVRDA